MFWLAVLLCLFYSISISTFLNTTMCSIYPQGHSALGFNFLVQSTISWLCPECVMIKVFQLSLQNVSLQNDWQADDIAIKTIFRSLHHLSNTSRHWCASTFSFNELWTGRLWVVFLVTIIPTGYLQSVKLGEKKQAIQAKMKQISLRSLCMWNELWWL